MSEVSPEEVEEDGSDESEDWRPGNAASRWTTRRSKRSARGTSSRWSRYNKDFGEIASYFETCTYVWKIKQRVHIWIDLFKHYCECSKTKRLFMSGFDGIVVEGRV